MSEQWKSVISRLIIFQLRLAVAAYVFTTILPYITEPGFEGSFWNWILRWGLIVVMAVILLGLMALPRHDFLRYGFFLVLIAGFYNVFIAILMPGLLQEVFVHFFAIGVAVYFVSRDLRIEVTKSKKHRHKSSHPTN